MSNHKHLRCVIEDIYANNNELTPNLAFKLVNEFRYSSLFIPAKRDENGLNFIVYEDDDLKILPLFTDFDEFVKFFKNTDGIELMENSFELYQNILKTHDFDGYILNPSSEKYLFRREFILGIENIPKTNYYSPDSYSISELKELAERKNTGLEEFISDSQNIGDFEKLFEILSHSVLLTLMVSDSDLSNFSEDGVISMMKTSYRSSMYTDNVGGVYATVFSSKDKMRYVECDKFKYSQIINLSMLVNFVLVEDLDGIILNSGSDDILIPRTTLLRYSLGFEKYANDEKLYNSIYYMFLID